MRKYLAVNTVTLEEIQLSLDKSGNLTDESISQIALLDRADKAWLCSTT